MTETENLPADQTEPQSEPETLVVDHQPAATDTTEAVRAATEQGADPEALTAAVAANHALAAPASEVEQILAGFARRLDNIESTVGMVAPVVATAINELTPVVAAVVPEAGPVLSRLPAIEATLGGIWAAITGHFGGKLEGMPPAP